MSAVDNLVDVSVAVGEGIYSVGVDLVAGFQRTGEGLGLGKDGRVSEIGYENRAMYDLIRKIVKFGVNDKQSPIHQAIVHILTNYYAHFPEEAVNYLAKEVGLTTAYVGGRLVIGKKIAEAVAVRIASAIGATAGYRALATRMGMSVSTSSTGIGAPIGIAMVQGVMQRASHASHRLKANCPELYFTLQRNGDLQLIYFILEEPMKTYIDAITAAQKDPEMFKRIVHNRYFN